MTFKFKKIFWAGLFISAPVVAIVAANSAINPSPKSQVLQTNVLVNQNIGESTQPQAPVEDQLDLNQNGIKRSVLDFYISSSLQEEVVKSYIKEWFQSFKNIILRDYKDISTITPDFDKNTVTVTYIYNGQTKNMVLTGLLANQDIPATDVRQPYSWANKTNRITIDIQQPNWKLFDLSTWVAPNKEDVYTYISKYIPEHIYKDYIIGKNNIGEFKWNGVMYYNIENLAILSNVSALDSKNVPFNVKLFTNDVKYNNQLLKEAINNSIAYQIKNEKIDEGYIDLSFYLKNYIEQEPVGTGPKVVKQFDPTVFNNSQNPQEQYIDQRIDIRLKGFFVPSQLKSTQEVDKDKDNLYIIIGLCSGFGLFLVVIIAFLIYHFIINSNLRKNDK